MLLHTPVLRALPLGRFRTHCLRRGFSLLGVGIVSMLGEISVAQAATDCNAVTEISKIECESLLQLYHSTDGANWKNNDGWNVSNTPCSWYGVTCENTPCFGSGVLFGVVICENNENNGVTEIALRNNNLNGTIPDFSALPVRFWMNFRAWIIALWSPVPMTTVMRGIRNIRVFPIS